MAVGEFVPTKFLWLLDMVEVVGIAMHIDGDDFDIEPDPNYRHLISYIRGNNPLPWQQLGSPGVLHCETYVPLQTKLTAWSHGLSLQNRNSLLK